MGHSSSKLVINSSEVVPATSSNEAQGTVKELNEQVVVEANEANGEANGDIPLADECAAAGDCEAPKRTHTKNPITWIHKKISFKKLKTPKKQSATVEPEKPDQPEGDAEAAEKEVDVNCAETQSEEVVKVDQGAGHSDPIGPEPIVEIAPTVNGTHKEGDEHYEQTEPISAEVPVEAEEEKAGTGVDDLGMQEKLASLGIDQATPTQNGFENGHENEHEHEHDEN